MPVKKPHDEFYARELHHGRETPAGYREGIRRKVVAVALDEDPPRGTPRGLLRFARGVSTIASLVREYWEDVLGVSRVIAVGNDVNGTGGRSFTAHAYACRPRGALHGPFGSDGGSLLLELHYFDLV